MTIEPIAARRRTDELIGGLVADLTEAQRATRTPCDEWDVDALVAHCVNGAHMIAGGLRDAATPAEMPDLMAEGPASAWAAASARLADAATPAALEAIHAMPFGEVPGAMALNVITADHVIHAWDLATALGTAIQLDDDLVELAMTVFGQLVPEDADRSGGQFKDVVPVDPDASAVDKMLGFSGRRP